MKSTLFVLLLVSILLSQGCCSIFKSHEEKVMIDSKPQGAKVEVGPYSGVTPYEVMVPRGKDYIIEANHNGKTKQKSLNKSIEPLYWVNILFWPGLIVDVATGDMFKYEPLSYNFDFTN